MVLKKLINDAEDFKNWNTKLTKYFKKEICASNTENYHLYI